MKRRTGERLFEVTLPDGTTAQRQSKHNYVAAVVGQVCAKDGTPIRWGVIQWNSRSDLAHRVCMYWQKIGPGLEYPTKNVQIVSVREV